MSNMFNPFRASPSSSHQPKKMINYQQKCQPKTKSTSAGPSIAGDREPEHKELEQSGDIDALQRHRLVEDNLELEWKLSGGIPNDPLTFHHIYFIEEDLREVVQEEEAIMGYGLEQSTSERLKALNRKYWLLEQQWWCYYRCLRQTHQQPGFDLWRSHPKWYMHQLLKEDCASRNGCCARACGCCSIREPSSPSRKLGVGHCTVECACCCKARGFQVSDEEKNALKKLFREQAVKFHKHPIIRVSSWGLVGECFENPFDMIDLPPSYENSTRD